MGQTPLRRGRRIRKSDNRHRGHYYVTYTHNQHPEKLWPGNGLLAGYEVVFGGRYLSAYRGAGNDEVAAAA
jgi:hypothetical protein